MGSQAVPATHSQLTDELPLAVSNKESFMGTRSNSLYKLNTTLNFGKYKGQPLSWVLVNNPSYILWACKTISWFKVEDKVLKLAKEADEELTDIRFKKTIKYYIGSDPSMSPYWFEDD